MKAVIGSDRLVAHRGYAARYPENTLLAVQEALHTGARYIEVDIQLSADRVPMVFHDDDLQRLCGHPGFIHLLTENQLSAMSCHYPAVFGDQFEGEPLASLAALMLLMQQFPAVLFFIELKAEAIRHFDRGTLLSAVTSVLAPVRDQTVLISYDLLILQQAAALKWRTGAVSDKWPDAADSQLQRLKPEFLFLSVNSLPTGSLAWQDACLAVFEVADPDLARTLMDRGIELVETFAIGEMRHALAQAFVAE